MEVALRCKKPAPVPLSGAAKAAGRTIDARGSFAASGPVSCGQRGGRADQRCRAGARGHHRATKRHVRLDEGRAYAGDAQRRLWTNLAVSWRWDAGDVAHQRSKEYPEGTTAYNAIGEIPGTDKKDEIVMLGGHYDSWHDATGATDNGIGSSMMLEAVRILSALHVKPRRTIRIALWSGEEQGLLGSLAYVQQHFGSFENQKPEYAKLDAYFNIDSGTGKPRGAGVFGPPAAADLVREAMMPFADWGFVGAAASDSRRRSEEHTSELQSPYDLVCRLLLEKKKAVKESIVNNPSAKRSAPPPSPRPLAHFISLAAPINSTLLLPLAVIGVHHLDESRGLLHL